MQFATFNQDVIMVYTFVFYAVSSWYDESLDVSLRTYF
jgi:hypothetical protein